jgi:hypothetical protein
MKQQPKIKACPNVLQLAERRVLTLKARRCFNNKNMKKVLQILMAFLMLIPVACKKDKLNTNLIAYYKFDGTLNDETKNENSGISHGISFGSDRSGNPNSALYLDSTSYVAIPYNDNFNLSSKTFTLATWIYPVKTKSTYVISKEGQLDANGNLCQGGGPYSLDIFPGTLRTVIYGYDISNYLVLEGKTLIKENEWQHIAVTMEGRLVKLYLNGQVDAEGNFNSDLQISNGNVNIGTSKWAHPYAAFMGKIDNVRIYNKTLSSEQIKELYDNYE